MSNCFYCNTLVDKCESMLIQGDTGNTYYSHIDCNIDNEAYKYHNSHDDLDITSKYWLSRISQ
jgi:hypothetical protein